MEAGFDFIAISTPFYCHDGQGQILLHKRSERCRDENGTWDCGSGSLDFGENPSLGVLREVKEEYGCDGIIQAKLDYYSILREHNGRMTHWIALPFIILVDRKKVINNEPEKISDIGWFQLKKLPTPLHSGFQFGLKKFEKNLNKFINN